MFEKFNNNSTFDSLNPKMFENDTEIIIEI